MVFDPVEICRFQTEVRVHPLASLRDPGPLSESGGLGLHPKKMDWTCLEGLVGVGQAQEPPFLRAPPANWAVFLVVDRTRAEQTILPFTPTLRHHLSEIMPEEKTWL